MKVLLIAYSFPPFHDAQSIRWYYLANVLAEMGVTIDVITIKHPVESSVPWRFHENIRINRVYAGLVESASLFAKSKIGVDEPGNEELRKSQKFKTMKSSYWAIRKLAGNLLPGDVRTEWFPFALKIINKKIHHEDYTCMITSHEPWVDSLLGLYLKRRNPCLRWIADFGDPYIAPYMPKHKLWFESILENSIYKNADMLVFTNARVIQYLEAKYPFLGQKKILVVEQGFSYSSYAENLKLKPPNDTFTLLYTGTLYRNFRDPSNLIKALSTIGFGYKLLLAGKNEEFLKDFAPLGKNFEFLGFIDHFSALKLQQDSDVLIHLGNKDSIQVPGKVYEYLGALRPILSIKYDAGDPSGKLVESLKCGVSCENDPIKITDALKILHERWRADARLSSTCGDIYEYSWENKAKILYESLEKNRI